MIPLAAAHVTREQPDKLKLVDALAAMDKSKKGDRLPVLTADDQPLYVIHRSTVDTFIAQSALGEESADDLKKLTLADLLADPFLGRQLESSFAVVPGTATQADAKRAMESIRWCQDVLVTGTGLRTEPVLGWVTNVIIEYNSRV